MKRIDFHIHTIATDSEAKFVFDQDELNGFVCGNFLDAIAITNHNKFDKHQFDQISMDVKNCIVFPGIEVDLDKGHILVICPLEMVEDFSVKCGKVEEIFGKTGDITLEEFKSSFQHFDEYLIIPHYTKKPRIPDRILTSLQPHIIAGEVDSPKKFEIVKKDNQMLTPVLFSDFRPSKDNKSELNNSPRLTFLECDDLTVPKIKLTLRDRTKVHIHSSKESNSFPLLQDGTKASTGLNIIIGQRSSGKSHTLNLIHNAYKTSRVKYIEQFQLIESNSEENFNKNLDKKRDAEKNNYFVELKAIVDGLSRIDHAKSRNDLAHFVDSLKEYAKASEKDDIFSKTRIFSENEKQEQSLDRLKKLIEAVTFLLETDEYESVVDANFPKTNRKSLLVSLINIYHKMLQKNKCISLTNEILRESKFALGRKSSKNPISSFNENKLLSELYHISRFNFLINEGGKTRIIESQKVGEYTILGKVSSIDKANDLKIEVGITGSYKAVVDANSPFERYSMLKDMSLSSNFPIENIFKSFWKIEYSVVNETNNSLSGGEKSDFNLIFSLRDAEDYDIVLIDELESSFDNLYLREHIMSLLKSLSKKSTLFLVTHNNTLGVSLWPDCIIYTEKRVESGNAIFKVYTGSITSPHLTSINGEEVPCYDKLLSTMEAGKVAYDERATIYEGLKNY
jgi:ABC-type lipoprotein export system ATPase subunit